MHKSLILYSFTNNFVFVPVGFNEIQVFLTLNLSFVILTLFKDFIWKNETQLPNAVAWGSLAHKANYLLVFRYFNEFPFTTFRFWLIITSPSEPWRFQIMLNVISYAIMVDHDEPESIDFIGWHVNTHCNGRNSFFSINIYLKLIVSSFRSFEFLRTDSVLTICKYELHTWEGSILLLVQNLAEFILAWTF